MRTIFIWKNSRLTKNETQKYPHCKDWSKVGIVRSPPAQMLNFHVLHGFMCIIRHYVRNGVVCYTGVPEGGYQLPQAKQKAFRRTQKWLKRSVCAGFNAANWIRGDQTDFEVHSQRIYWIFLINWTSVTWNSFVMIWYKLNSISNDRIEIVDA